MYKNTCKSIQEERHLILTENYEEKEVIDYFVMYDIEESTKNLPTEIENSELVMFDEFGQNHNVEIESANDITEMLASVRMLSCQFVKKDN